MNYQLLLTLEYGVSGAGVARSWADKMQAWIIELSDASSPNAFAWMNEEYYNFLSFFIQGLCVVVLLVGLRLGKAFVNGMTGLKVSIVILIIVAGFDYLIQII